MWLLLLELSQAKQKYRGVLEIQKTGDKTSLGEICLDIRTHASPKVGQDQVSGGVSVLSWHAAPVALNTSLTKTSQHERYFLATSYWRLFTKAVTLMLNKL